jgi:chromosome segregation ATPase
MSDARAPPPLVLEHVHPETRLLEKRRQMFEVQDRLEEQKAAFAKASEAFDRREETLRRKDLDLQESLVRFSKFLQENDGKKARAERKAGDERKLRLQKEAELDRLSDDLAALRVAERRASDLSERKNRYAEYLDAVVDAFGATNGYGEIDDLIARHQTLVDSNADLMRQDQQLAAAIDAARKSSLETAKEKQDQILNLNNDVARLKTELEAAKKEADELEKVREAVQSEMGERTMEHGRVCMAADNLFHRCRGRSAVKYKRTADPVEQLGVIGDYVHDLDKIVKQHGRDNPGLLD